MLHLQVFCAGSCDLAGTGWPVAGRWTPAQTRYLLGTDRTETYLREHQRNFPLRIVCIRTQKLDLTCTWVFRFRIRFRITEFTHVTDRTYQGSESGHLFLKIYSTFKNPGGGGVPYLLYVAYALYRTGIRYQIEASLYGIKLKQNKTVLRLKSFTSCGFVSQLLTCLILSEPTF
jgi:hypothetical protein